MIRQTELGNTESEQKRSLARLVKTGLITRAGNRKLKIFGRLNCRSGMRMKPENRVFFSDESEARRHGYRPCGHCMPKAYQHWKAQLKVRHK